MDSCICYECFDDTYLKEIVKNGYDIDECSICGNDDKPAISIEDLGKLIEPIVREVFEFGQEIPYIADNDKTYWKQEGDDLSYVVSTILGQDFDCHEDIVDATVDAEIVYPQDGEEAFITKDMNYVEPASRGAFMWRWMATQEELKHSRRFFSLTAQELFVALFKGMDALKCRHGRSQRSVVRVYKVGTKIYRARPRIGQEFLKEAYADPVKHLGPPPPDLAKAGRMNAEGVVVFYGAMDKNTCLAEMRPTLSSKHLVIQLETTKKLRILDFSLLEEAWDESKSYFDPEYSDSRDRLEFLKLLHHLISRPIVPGNESEYLITQTMAEYLAHIHETPVDGILFKSAQRAGGKNIVLFKERGLLDAAPADAFPLAYRQDSIELFSTMSIQYRHFSVPIRPRTQGPGIDPEWDGLNDDIDF